MKRTRLPYTQQKGTRWYHVKRQGKRVAWTPLPGDPATDPEAMRLYHRLNAGIPIDAKPKHNMAALIDSYMDSQRWPARNSTRTAYLQRLNLIRERNGDTDVRRFTRPTIISIRDKLAKQSTNRADAIVTMFSILFEHAIDKGLRKDNPAKGVSRVNVPAERQPWPAALVERARAAMTGPERTILELCLGTACRLGDALTMRWDAIEDDGIVFIPEKSRDRQPLWVPFTPECSAYLATLPRTLNTIVSDGAGQSLTKSQADKALRAVWASYGGEGFTWHGLRYSAIEALGHLTDEQVSSISGHKSRAMVAKYTGKTRQRKLAREARKG